MNHFRPLVFSPILMYRIPIRQGHDTKQYPCQVLLSISISIDLNTNQYQLLNTSIGIGACLYGLYRSI